MIGCITTAKKLAFIGDMAFLGTAGRKLARAG